MVRFTNRSRPHLTSPSLTRSATCAHPELDPSGPPRRPRAPCRASAAFRRPVGSGWPTPMRSWLIWMQSCPALPHTARLNPCSAFSFSTSTPELTLRTVFLQEPLFYRDGSDSYNEFSARVIPPSARLTSPSPTANFSTFELTLNRWQKREMRHHRPETAAVNGSCKSHVARGWRTRTLNVYPVVLHKSRLSSAPVATCYDCATVLACCSSPRRRPRPRGSTEM